MTTYQVPHPIVRAWERYGVTLQHADLVALEDQIHNRQSMCLHKLPRAELHAVSHGGVALLAIYRPGENCIVTFLPEEAAYDTNARRRWLQEECETGHNASPFADNGAKVKRNWRACNKKANATTKHQRQLDASDGYDEDHWN